MPRPKNPDAPTRAERSHAWRLARKARGARELNVSLTPENSAKADAMVERGEAASVSGLVNALIAAA